MTLDVGTGAPVVYFSMDEVSADMSFIAALAQRYRLLAPRPVTSGTGRTSREQAELLIEFIRATAGGAVHLVAESGATAAVCWLAVQEPSLVQSLVLVTPTAPDADLTQRLGEISAPTLILWGTADEVTPPHSGQLFLQRIPNSYRILIYGAAHALPASACRQFVELVTDFIERGDRFVVAEPA